MWGQTYLQVGGIAGCPVHPSGCPQEVVVVRRAVVEHESAPAGERRGRNTQRPLRLCRCPDAALGPLGHAAVGEL